MPHEHQFSQVFQLIPTPSVLLLPDAPKFTIVAVNNAYLEALNVKEVDLIGKGIFEAFPENPDDLISKGSSNLTNSLEQLIFKKESHKIPVQKYNMLLPGTSKFKIGYFNIQNIPVKDDNKINYILHSVEDVTDKKNLEIRFESERQRFNDLYLQAPSCMGILKGPNHVYEMANPTYLQLINKKNIIGKSIKEIRPEAAEQGLIEILNQVYKTGKAFSANERPSKLDKEANGEIVDIYQDLLLQPHKDNTGNIDGIFFFFTDVTEKVESRKKIEESEVKFKKTFDMSPIGIVMVGSDKKFLHCNNAFAKSLGYATEEIVGLTFEELTFPEDKLLGMPEMKALIKGEVEIANIHKRYVRKDKQLIWADLTISLIRDNENGPLYFIAIIQDITKRKETEEERDLLIAIIEQSSDFIGTSDMQGNILYHNPAAKAMIGLSDDSSMKGMKIENLCPERLLDLVFNEELPTAIRDGKWQSEFALKHIDGHEVPVSQLLIVHKDKNGIPIYTSTVMRDITNLKLAEINLKKINEKIETQNKELAFQNHEKAKRASELIIANKELDFQNEEKEKRAAELVIANKELAFQNEEKENQAAELGHSNKELVKTNTELDRFVYSVSHDLRSPLTSILGLISFIEEDSREPDTLEQVKMIRSSINRLDGFIKNILSYSQNNRTGLETKKIPIKKAINKIVNSVRNIKEAKGISFQVDIDEQKPFYSDWQRFNTILENLISNGVKHHTKEVSGRYLKLTGTTDSEELKLSISDNGIGIDPEFHDKIFEMFYRLSGTTAGSGFGLYIVKETLEKLHGTIEIQSEKGVGTTFSITLKNLKNE